MSASAVLAWLYALTIVGMGVFAFHKLKMIWLYLRRRSQFETAHPPLTDALGRAKICVQCPVYNEPLVIEALLDAVSALRWSAGTLEIQLLDDSSDDTPARITRWLAAHPEAATRVRHLRRPERTGYKAGALAYGLGQTDAEFFAIFDADFRPRPDFLEKLLPHFASPEVGLVQARWEFSNRRSSLLTRFQAAFLDAHFVVEQTARHASGLFFNFNGTAGVWRRAALEEAGGWTPDTVNEDLDVSYRAQLRGWRFVYCPAYSVDSELPESLTAFKSQQHRWTKGGIQVMRKQLGTILRSGIAPRRKREAAWHLLVGFIHPLLVFFSLIFVPYLVLGVARDGAWGLLHPVFIVVTFVAAVGLYLFSQYLRTRTWQAALGVAFAAPLLLAFGLALSVTNALAVFEGLTQHGGEFVRTPKGGRRAPVRGLVDRFRKRARFLSITAAELGLGALMLFGTLHFAHAGFVGLTAILAFKALGFFSVATLSLTDLLPARNHPPAP